MKKFKSFITEKFEPISNGEKGKLYIEEDNDDNISEWKFSLILEKTWKDYTDKNISLSDFNKIYAKTLIENEQQISSIIGESAWKIIEEIAINDLKNSITLEESEKIYDKLYDLYDKHEIYINTGSINEEIFENLMDNQPYSVGDIVIINFKGVDKTAKITKINSKFSYLVKIEENSIFLNKEYEIKRDSIKNMVMSNQSPAGSSDWNQPLKQHPSNDYAINGSGTPGVPSPGTPLR